MSPPIRGLRKPGFMVTRVCYYHGWYRSARDCVVAIRRQVEAGWSVSQVRGERDGPFLVIFRKDAVA